MRLAVPRVACFAMIDLARPGGRLERAAYEHIDESRKPLLDRPDPFFPEEEGLVPLAHVLESGDALLVEQVERDWTGSERILERIRSLDGRSLMMVPLTVADERLGVLTFGSTRTDRFYHQWDLSLAIELARSAALALHNARLYRRAEQAIAARDEVLAVVSHDLRNPVNRVRLAAELMLELYELSEPARKTAGMIVRSADEMNRLIGDLLDVARIEGGRLSLDIAPTPLGSLLDQLDEAHAPAAKEMHLSWTVERPSEAITLEIDAPRVLQALGNLVGNAVKFTPEGGHICVLVQRTNESLRLGVRDNGPGMTEEQLANAFDRFWQSRAGDRRGAGLGLAIAQGIIAAHGGRIRLESEIGAGTTAWVELPVVRQESSE